MANFTSLGDLNREDSDDERDDTNDYYAGGEKSGMVVQGGEAGGNASNRAVVDDLFQSARRLGARDGNPDDLRAPRSGAAPSSSKNAFTGSSYTLSGGANESQARGSQVGGSADPDAPDMHTITFYRNGIFTVDDGEPRDVQDPANKDFIDSIGRGEVPREFDRKAQQDESSQETGPGGLARPPTQPVHVNLVSRMEEDYKPPAKPKYVAFAGQGLKLSGGASQQQSSAAASQDDNGPATFELDETKPVTSIQLRLMDGTRMVARFNPGVHTIRDIRAFINMSRPGFAGQGGAPYQLVTAFPTTVLTEEGKTIEEAGLANAVILQKAC
ncbi:UBX domain-containing protein [Chloropicon roscoffensis]|uniref:UBX domain-containing protein n=1 Tax=Chloropicon roscoffensis TaxID=1461544 RepID=A0A7S3FQU1_9CHLO